MPASDVAALRRAALGSSDADAPRRGPWPDDPLADRRQGWVPEPESVLCDGSRDPAAGSGGRVAELTARVADRVPPAWRGARWGIPVPAGVVLLVVSLLVGVGVLVVTTRAAPGAAEPTVLPARTDAAAPSPAAATASSPPPGVDVVGHPPHAGPVEPPGVVVVHVVGQVVAPGVVELPAGARVADAVEAVGGLAENADVARVNLARPLVDGEQVVVPRPGEELDAAVGPTAPAGGIPAATGAAAADAPLDLNTATAGDLESLPGIGPVLGARIVEWRESHGRFTAVDELREVSGIGDSLLEKLRPLVRV